MANPNAGHFAWHELVCTDIDAAVKFYKGLFGWTVKEMPMGPGMGTYYLFRNGDKDVAGGMKAPQRVPSNWLVYVAVDDCDKTAQKLTELGGKVMVPPTTVPDMLRFACAFDPQGAAFGILQSLGQGGRNHCPKARIRRGLSRGTSFTRRTRPRLRSSTARSSGGRARSTRATRRSTGTGCATARASAA